MGKCVFIFALAFCVIKWDISAQLFPSLWEFDSCPFGEWWWRDLYLSKCYCTCGELTSIKLVVCKDFAM
jgi:hypothetical protein